jgi:competence protein ComEC
VLDVGQGLSVVVQTSTHALLYDAGPQYSAQNDAGSRIIVPFLRGEGIRELDTFIVSHDDSDHSGGMQSVLTQVPVHTLLTTFAPQIQRPVKAVDKRCVAGQRWQWDGVHFEILHPSLESDADRKDNDRSCVLKVTSQAGSMLLTGDIERAAELKLLATYPERLKSDVLLVPHHGSKTSSMPDFIAAVQPQVSVFTVGYLNRFGHPKPLIVSRHQAADSRIYRSDQHGALQLQFQASAGNINIMDWRGQQKRYWHDAFQ